MSHSLSLLDSNLYDLKRGINGERQKVKNSLPASNDNS